MKGIQAWNLTVKPASGNQPFCDLEEGRKDKRQREGLGPKQSNQATLSAGLPLWEVARLVAAVGKMECMWVATARGIHGSDRVGTEVGRHRRATARGGVAMG